MKPIEDRIAYYIRKVAQYSKQNPRKKGRYPRLIRCKKAVYERLEGKKC